MNKEELNKRVSEINKKRNDRLDKTNVLDDFMSTTIKSWTYNKMDTSEKNNWIKILSDVRTIDSLKGTYQHKWAILQALYYSYLIGIGYTDFNWREEEH